MACIQSSGEVVNVSRIHTPKHCKALNPKSTCTEAEISSKPVDSISLETQACKAPEVKTLKALNS